ncbi:hypothetical protein BDV28DRAFT_130552 [Aspergillus coremiiformis]|uniref:Uncharacterized protein n=1 Tax=Aspergillus coremiiformis TaxID=138285 RepID=A0A5N6ZD13_9EURO|nr:hypothetical protein BDV28DRAFT_130552 [Aspergillus coremiiformis]
MRVCPYRKRSCYIMDYIICQVMCTTLIPILYHKTYLYNPVRPLLIVPINPYGVTSSNETRSCLFPGVVLYNPKSEMELKPTRLPIGIPRPATPRLLCLVSF